MSLDEISSLTQQQQSALLEGPALQPPLGVVPDFDSPPNRNDLAQATNALCLIATSVVVLIRAYAKLACVKKVEIEDFLALVALSTYVGCIYCSYSMLEVSGLFVHQWNVRLMDLSTILYNLHVGSNLCAVSILTIKSAILLEWCRIFVPRGTRNWFLWSCYIVLFLHALYHVAWIISENLSCTPYKKIWDKTIAEGHCINTKATFVPASAVNVVANIVILALPHKAIWDLQTTTRNKLGISMVFMIGFFACLSSCGRLVETVKFYRSEDTAYTFSGMYLWALAEMTCLFFVFCVPVSPIVFKQLQPVSRLTASFRSWTGLTGSGKRSTTPSPQSSWPRNRPGPWEDPWSVFSKSDENRIILMKFPSTEERMTEVTARQSVSVPQPGSGILRTTHFTAEITTIGEGVHPPNSRETISRQEAWANTL
ncbi:hypothetical protein F5Y15DRAFT_71834 [Xylariaceae sp. FL0016]|nr:hypothetical protein F5Y15DRAFT_71834 [Xylariaceae sp. FL0016]